MERYLVTLSWTQRQVEQVNVSAASALDAAAEGRIAMRQKHRGQMVQTSGGEDFRAIEVQQITTSPSPPKRMPKGKWGDGPAVNKATAAKAAAKPPRAGRFVPCRDKKEAV